jgi:hypothetical protein
MSDNVFPFNKENEEPESCCPFCELTDEFLMYAIEAESVSEMREILRDLVSEASKLGMLEMLQQEISQKAELMDILIYGDED